MMSRVASLGLLAACAVAAHGAEGPCDIYDAAGTPCVAAHSTVRALYGAYAGPLYVVRRSPDNATLDIGVTAAGGAADAAEQDAFCAAPAAAACEIVRLYDQSARANHLDTAPGGPFYARKPDRGVNASRLRLTVGRPLAR